MSLRLTNNDIGNYEVQDGAGSGLGYAIYFMSGILIMYCICVALS